MERYIALPRFSHRLKLKQLKILDANALASKRLANTGVRGNEDLLRSLGCIVWEDILEEGD